MWSTLCRYVTYPLWDLWDGTGRLAELRSLNSSQWWDPERLRALQLDRLKSIVDYAYNNCRYYQSHWGDRPDIGSLPEVTRLPLVTKADIANKLHDFVSSRYSTNSLISASTGGSTGTALQVYFDTECQKMRNAAAMRSDGWAGWQPGALTGALWGTPPVAVTLKERIRSVFHDRVIYLDTMLINESTMATFASQLATRGAKVLFGHAHSLFVFASFVKATDTKLPPIHGIVSTSMMLLDSERMTIEDAFRCRVSNRYGCEEVGLIASECEQHTGLHVNAEHVLVEIVRPDGSPAAPGESGRIVVTDLVNHAMPLVRYEIGDMAVGTNALCGCGRGLPLLAKLVGRLADNLCRRDGSQIAGVSLVEKTLTAIKGLEQLQIVQESIDDFLLNVVPTRDYSQASEEQLAKTITNIFGQGVRVTVRKVERLSQERNGKYRFAICRVQS
jgi:phenylacetate-CoA ligase